MLTEDNKSNQGFPLQENAADAKAVSLSLVFPGEESIAASEPAEPIRDQNAPSGVSYKVIFTRSFKRPAGPGFTLLHRLINAPLQFDVKDSNAGALLASSKLDMLDLGLGAHTICRDIELAASPAASGPVKVHCVQGD
jgi:hypothetical protein